MKDIKGLKVIGLMAAVAVSAMSSLAYASDQAQVAAGLYAANELKRILPYGNYLNGVTDAGEQCSVYSGAEVYDDQYRIVVSIKSPESFRYDGAYGRFPIFYFNSTEVAAGTIKVESVNAYSNVVRVVLGYDLSKVVFNGGNVANTVRVDQRPGGLRVELVNDYLLQRDAKLNCTVSVAQ